MIATVLAWIGKFVPLDKLALGMLAVSIAGCLLLFVALVWVRADAAMLRADNALLSDAVGAKEAAMAVLEREKADLESIIAKRDSRIAVLQTAAAEAATAIQGAADESPECGNDARMSLSLTDPLHVLFAKAASGDGSAGDSAEAPGKPVPAKADAGAAGAQGAGHDAKANVPMAGAAHNMGR